jgi:NADPH:quinone reductase-like Zn-dependent oxidoreductase
MKAIAINEHGGLDNLRVIELPKPEPGAGEVRVRVAAAALNWLDIVTVGGIPGIKLTMPHVVCSDGAGTIDAAGPGVEGYAQGDRVAWNPGLWCGACGPCRDGEHSQCDRYMILGEHVPGSCAEFVVVPARNLVKVPDGFSMETAAAATLAYQTAWRMAITRGRVKAGETVLVLGAGSGLSTALIQVCKLAGATVYATTSTAEKMEHARKIGADKVFNYREQNWSKEVFLATGKRGVDVVFDSVGKETLNDSLRSVRKGGRVVVPGGTTGQDVELNLRYLYWKQVDLLGSTMGTQAEFETVMRLVFDGRLEPVIDSTYPLADAKKAFESMAKGEKFGKLVVTMNGA